MAALSVAACPETNSSPPRSDVADAASLDAFVIDSSVAGDSHHHVEELLPRFGFLGVPFRGSAKTAEYQQEVLQGVGQPFFYRTGLNWVLIDKDKTGVYDFSFYDTYYDFYSANGAVAFFTIPPGTREGMADDYNYKQPGYEALIEASARRFSTRAVWQLGNEVNSSRSGVSTPAEYLDFARATAGALRAGDPDATIIMAGLSELRKQDFSASLAYFSEMLRLGICDLVDGFDLHLRSFAHDAAPPQIAGDSYLHMAPVMTAFKAAAAAVPACQNKRWFVTETGTYGGDGGLEQYCNTTKCPSCETHENHKGEYVVERSFYPDLAGTLIYQTEEQQASDYARRLPWALSIGVDHIFSGEFTDGQFGCPDSIWYYEGLLTNSVEEQVKLAFFTVRLYLDKLNLAVFEERLVTPTDELFVLQFKSETGRKWVTWSDAGPKQRVTITGIRSSQVKLTRTVPPSTLDGSHYPLSSYPGILASETRDVSTQGSLQLELEQVPVLIEEI